MDPVTLTATALTIGGKLIDKIFPDKEAADKAKLALFELQQKGELAVLEADTKIALAQTETNKVEAAAGAYRGGWRPAAGWVCSLGLGYQFLAQPLLVWASGINGWYPPPALDLTDLIPLLFGMLGLGVYRSAEKIKGLP